MKLPERTMILVNYDLFNMEMSYKGDRKCPSMRSCELTVCCILIIICS